ncbi:MAG: hypothetical protein AAGH79_12320 [Bacteroidota bacterium]
MNLQQSAKPYLALLLFLLVGIPLSQHFLQQRLDKAAVEIVVEIPVPTVIAKN